MGATAPRSQGPRRGREPPRPAETPGLPRRSRAQNTRHFVGVLRSALLRSKSHSVPATCTHSGAKDHLFLFLPSTKTRFAPDWARLLEA